MLRFFRWFNVKTSDLTWTIYITMKHHGIMGVPNSEAKPWVECLGFHKDRSTVWDFETWRNKETAIIGLGYVGIGQTAVSRKWLGLIVQWEISSNRWSLDPRMFIDKILHGEIIALMECLGRSKPPSSSRVNMNKRNIRVFLSIG